MSKPPVQMALPFHSRELAEVETVLNRAITAGDPLIASEYGNSLSNSIKMKGVALAKLLYGLRESWPLFVASGIEEEFLDFVDAHMHVRSRTASKYADMYGEVFVKAKISDVLKEQLSHKQITTLLLLTAAVREGSLDEEQLTDVVILDHSGVQNIVRAARGDATNSNTAAYARLVQREHSRYPLGTIVAFGNGESEPIGSLKLDPSTDAGKKIVERFKNKLNLEDIR